LDNPNILHGKTIFVTGASGTLGRALLRKLYLKGATVVALTSQNQTLEHAINGQTIPIRTLHWQVGQETGLAESLKEADILILNHGLNVYSQRTPQAIDQSYQINAFSQWRLLELFLETHPASSQGSKSVWVNTSEAEVNPAFSPLYELSKRTLGDLVTLRRLDAPCIIRKLILGPFRSALNPVGVMSGDWVAQQIIAQAERGCRNIIVTVNPLTYLLFPPKEFLVSTYFRLLTKA
jgi:nucleoside-diphosphate-sugar epimerase